MRFVFLAGGFAGFVLVGVTGLVAGREAGPVLRDAALGCLACALLFRWFWTVLVKALADTLEHRRRDAEAAEAARPSPSAAAPLPTGRSLRGS